jgi:hypothetical protein
MLQVRKFLKTAQRWLRRMFSGFFVDLPPEFDDASMVDIRLFEANEDQVHHYVQGKVKRDQQFSIQAHDYVQGKR